MRTEDFYKLYIPALEEAFKNDSINYGFYVKPPEDYLNDDIADLITQYLEDNEDDFTEKIGYYFDAKSHNFSSIKGISIDAYKQNLISEMFKIKKKYS